MAHKTKIQRAMEFIQAQPNPEAVTVPDVEEAIGCSSMTVTSARRRLGFSQPAPQVEDSQQLAEAKRKMLRMQEAGYHYKQAADLLKQEFGLNTSERNRLERYGHSMGNHHSAEAMAGPMSLRLMRVPFVGIDRQLITDTLRQLPTV